MFYLRVYYRHLLSMSTTIKDIFWFFNYLYLVVVGVIGEVVSVTDKYTAQRAACLEVVRLWVFGGFFVCGIVCGLLSIL